MLTVSLTPPQNGGFRDSIGSFLLLLGSSRTSADDCDLSPPLKLVPQTSDDVVSEGGVRETELKLWLRWCGGRREGKGREGKKT